jgi:hypothetical protein
MSLTTVEIRSFSGPSVVDMEGSGEPSIVYINQGPAGDVSCAPISTITSTNLTGYIYGNGATIGGATSASSSGTPNTLVLRDGDGRVSFSSGVNNSSTIVVNNTGATIDEDSFAIYATSTGSDSSGGFFEAESGAGLIAISNSASGLACRSISGIGASITSNNGTYHAKFGEYSNDISAIERVRGWFVWFYNSFIGRLKTADITANREWTLPNASGFVALTANANGAVTNSEVYAKAAVPITAGQAVYISGASGANKIISLAQANTDPLSSKTLGLSLQNLTTNAFGYVVTEGDLSGLSIDLGSGHGVTEGDPIWLSPTTPGGLLYGLANKPSAPNHLVFLGVVTRINGNTLTDIFVKVQNGFEIDELHNVAINGKQNGQVLTYESSTQLWKNKATYTAKSTTGNPATGIEGEICINTFDNNVKIYAEGGWRQIAAW